MIQWYSMGLMRMRKVTRALSYEYYTIIDVGVTFHWKASKSKHEIKPFFSDPDFARRIRSVAPSISYENMWYPLTYYKNGIQSRNALRLYDKKEYDGYMSRGSLSVEVI